MELILQIHHTRFFPALRAKIIDIFSIEIPQHNIRQLREKK